MAKESEREVLEKKLKKISEIAKRSPAENTTLGEVLADHDLLPPYGLALAAFESMTEDAYPMDISPKSKDGRVRTKGTIATLKTLDSIGRGMVYASGGFIALTIAALETPIALPRLALDAVRAGINKNYNKRIKKAKVVEEQLKNKLEALDKANSEENQMQ